ncbi:MAG: hypothetical protein AABY22_06845 [Nanoarchaeota archaeon]
MVKIPKSLKDAIDEDPDRFIYYLDLQEIFKSNNPYQEFLRQFQIAFGNNQGLNLWQYVVDKYQLLNQLYKDDSIQKGLPKQFKGSLNRKEVKIFFENYKKEVKEKQKKLIPTIKKQIKMPSYIRKGKEIRQHNRTKGEKYTERQKSFILKHKNYEINRLTFEFNRLYKTSKTNVAIRDKRLRLLGKKK